MLGRHLLGYLPVQAAQALVGFGGVAILMIVNLIRIITLFLTAVHWPNAFDVMHLDVWQAAFIFLAIVLWALWASWAARRRRAQAKVPAETPNA